MMDDDVLGADRGEAVAAEVADAFWEARRVRREQQIGTVIDDQLPQIGDAQDAVGDMGLVRGGAGLGGDQGAQFVRHVRVDAEMDRDPAPAALQRRFVGADEVLGLFLELHVGVADQAELALAGDAEAGEQPVEEQPHQIVEDHEADRLADRARQPDEPIHLAGQRQQRPHALPILLAQHQQGHHQAHVGDERERMRRVDRERRQHREHPLHEPRVEPFHIVGRKFLRLAHLDAGFAQQAAQFAPHPLLLGEQRFGAELDLGKLLRRRPSVG